ncbi:MAG: hypothetical protein QOH31_4855 [Verrucomicrobiota bacterium]
MKLLYLKQKIERQLKLSLCAPFNAYPHRRTTPPLFLSTHLLFLISCRNRCRQGENLGVRGRAAVSDRRAAFVLMPGSPITNQASFTRPARKGLRALPQSAIWLSVIRDRFGGDRRIINDPSIRDLQMSLRDCRHFQAMRSHHQCGHSALRDHPKDLE